MPRAVQDPETSDASQPAPRSAPAGLPRPAGFVALGLLLPSAILAASTYFILTRAPRHAGLAGSVPLEAVAPKPPPSAAPTSSAQPRVELSEPDEPLDFQDLPGAEAPNARAPARPRYKTVREAATRSCSTASVDGLSRQIIAQARCIDANAFVPLPALSNLVTKPYVYAFFRAPAQRHLLQALKANPKRTMTLHSALRTIAQQYLLYRWGSRKQCGIRLAAEPGTSNHESGLALDISNPGDWRSALRAEGFEWMGEVDRVHFDYKGGGGTQARAIDGVAFAQLWNKNHKDDRIKEDGRYSAALKERLEQAPAQGFELGPSCRKGG